MKNIHLTIKTSFSACTLRWLAMVLIIPLFTACTPGIAPRPAVDANAVAVEQAMTLQLAGDYLGAAEAYLQLAGRVPRSAAYEYQILAARALVQAGERDRARQLMAGIQAPAGLPSVKMDLLSARMALDEHRPYDALRVLEPLTDEGLDEATGRQLLQTRAEAYEQSGNYLEAARQLVRMEIYLVDQAVLDENRERIWGLLEKMHPEVLDKLRQPAPDTLSGWMELVVIAKRYASNPEALQRALADWNQRYPNHPGQTGMVREIQALTTATTLAPDRVALLLPLDGRFSAAAAAVRDGFLSAWFAEHRLGPSISVYASRPDNVLEMYQAAVDGGAALVVGPLDKESAAEFTRVDSLPVPILLLNNVEQPTVVEEQGEIPLPLPDQLYQFSLSPEDEAAQVAQRAWQDGHTRAGVLVPDSDWGQRVAAAFIQAWQDLGGLVVAQAAYGSNDLQLSAAVAGLLNIDRSKRRAQALKNRLGRSDIVTEPRRRQDVDMVFMAAFPTQGRQLRPQFQFHRASRLPLYSTSHIFTGQVDAQADRDLNGVIIGDMPWILQPEQADGELHRQIQVSWPAASKTYARLFALGVDAYRVIPQLQLLHRHGFTRMQGVTGQLYSDSDARLHRELVWARFSNGVPRTLEPVQWEAPLFEPTVEAEPVNMQ